MLNKKYFVPAVFPAFAIALLLGAATAQADTLYSNGFETNTTDWTADVTRVSSGTNGITAASGSWYAQSHDGSFSRWGGYNYGAGNNIPTTFREYTTSLDIYLDVSGGWTNDTRFDFSSAISNSSGGFLRDFVFNAGFYNDATGPGANTNRFVVSAGNNAGRSGAFPKNTGAIAINSTGWYTFQDHFYNDGGFLKVDLQIINAATAAVVGSWSIPANPTDAIATVGGNRYGWFVSDEFGTLAIDNARLDAAPAPAAPLPAVAWAGLSLMGGVGGVRGIKRRLRHRGA